MTGDEALEIKNAAIAAVAQALSSPVRLRVLGILAQAEHSVDALAEKIGQSRANTSAQLKVLSAAGLLASRKEGRRVFYRPASERVPQLLGALSDAAAELHAEMRDLVHTYFHLPERLDHKTVRELKRRVRAGEVVLVDLRPAEEHAAGHPSGAIHAPADALDAHLDAIPADREVIAFCRGRFCVVAEEGTRRLREAGLSATNLGASPAHLMRFGYPAEAALRPARVTEASD